IAVTATAKATAPPAVSTRAGRRPDPRARLPASVGLPAPLLLELSQPELSAVGGVGGEERDAVLAVRGPPAEHAVHVDGVVGADDHVVGGVVLGAAEHAHPEASPASVVLGDERVRLRWVSSPVSPRPAPTTTARPWPSTATPNPS